MQNLMRERPVVVWKIKVCYQAEPKGEMLVHDYDHSSAPSGREMNKVLKSWQSKKDVHKVISIQRHRIEYENWYIG